MKCLRTKGLPVPHLCAFTGTPPTSGHGEGFFWQASPDGAVIAVDAGRTQAVGRDLAGRGPEILLLSHDDNDHIGGAVTLIEHAHGVLRELWVPAEWGILVKQIAMTSADSLMPEGPVTISLSAIEAHIATQVNIIRGTPQEGQPLQVLVAEAQERLGAWDVDGIDPAQGRDLVAAVQTPALRPVNWYGAVTLEDIVKRTRSRSRAILDIFDAAEEANVRVRFFSIDLALSTVGPYWQQEGRPGTATLANAAEVPGATTILMPTGLPVTYALTHLSVQNRRALSTLLWSEASSPAGGAIIWSDTDGGWLDHSSPRGFNAVVATAAVSSAPHHASGNPAHDRVWQELAALPSSAVMIRAGGQSNQSYRREYIALHSRRCCTRCHVLGNPASQDVGALSAQANQPMLLTVQCLVAH